MRAPAVQPTGGWSHSSDGLTRGWSGKTNGELLALMMAAGYDVMLTVDQNIRYQQNLRAAGMAVVVMVGASNQLSDLGPLAAAVLAALATIKPGEVVEVR